MPLPQGALRHKQAVDLPGLMVYADPGIRQHCPWYSADRTPSRSCFILLQHTADRSPGSGHPGIPAPRLLADARRPSAISFAAASSCSSFFTRRIFSPRFHLGKLGQRVGLAPGHTGPGGAGGCASRLWRPRQSSILLWSPVSSTGGIARPSHTSGRVNWGYSSRPSQ